MFHTFLRPAMYLTELSAKMLQYPSLSLISDESEYIFRYLVQWGEANWVLYCSSPPNLLHILFLMLLLWPSSIPFNTIFLLPHNFLLWTIWLPLKSSVSFWITYKIRCNRRALDLTICSFAFSIRLNKRSWHRYPGRNSCKNLDSVLVSSYLTQFYLGYGILFRLRK